MKLNRFIHAIALATVAVTAMSGSAIAQKTRKPTLIVFLTVDQMRADYFVRFAPQLTGGLHRLYSGGAVMTNGFQDHAITETAPGHSATMSGRFPVHTGIMMNSLGVNDTDVKLVGAVGMGASPFRFKGTTLFDWMKAADAESRVLSVSRKDRGAILPVGKSKSPVFWYAPNGTFTTSTYYSDTLPTWLVAFNAKHRPQRFAGQSWTPLLPEKAYDEIDSVPLENGGKNFVFPHRFPADSAQAAAALGSYPWMDQVTLEAALAGVRAMKLGIGPHTDLLAVSLSTTDAIGHTYGPDSREIHDQILRLDQFLGAFFDTLFAMRDSRRVVVVLTADHAIGPIPGVKSHDAHAGAMQVDINPVWRAMRAALDARGVPKTAFTWTEGVVTADRAALKAANVDVDSLVQAFREQVTRVPGVLRADRIPELQKRDTVHDDIARRWLHMFDNDSSVVLVVTMKPYNYWASAFTGGQHGTPHDYDAHVPILFYGAPFKRGAYAATSRVVDIAPTLARVLNIPVGQTVDGRPLKHILRER